MRHAELVRAALDGPCCASWLARADARLGRELAAPGPDFSPTNTSLPLSACPEFAFDMLWRALGQGSAMAALRRAFGGAPLACCFSQSWLRRQYPPQLAPALHRPHQWHQDGALGFDFMAAAPPRQGTVELIALQTLWLSLVACGRDAPGLEIIDREPGRLLRPHELIDGAVHALVGQANRVRPALRAGDALRFGGGLLHRTHVAPAMTRVRTSIELRFCAQRDMPDRLRHERWIAVPD